MPSGVLPALAKAGWPRIKKTLGFLCGADEAVRSSFRLCKKSSVKRRDRKEVIDEFQ
jgi:hypothetical protein